MLWVLVEDMHWHLLFDIKPFLVAWTIWQRLTVDKIDREDTRTGKEQDESVVIQWILHKTCSWNKLSRSSWCFEFSFKTCNMEVWNIFLFDIKPLHAAWSFWPGLTVDKIGRERIKENMKKHKLKVYLFSDAVNLLWDMHWQHGWMEVLFDWPQTSSCIIIFFFTELDSGENPERG